MKKNAKQNDRVQPPAEVKVDALGSLGLLALGHIGLRKWREAKEEQKKKNVKKK